MRGGEKAGEQQQTYEGLFLSVCTGLGREVM